VHGKNHGDAADHDSGRLPTFYPRVQIAQIVEGRYGPNTELMNAIIDAFAAYSVMSKQALDSEKVRSGLEDVLLWGRRSCMRHSGPGAIVRLSRFRRPTDSPAHLAVLAMLYLVI
jgi:hypothetical protein